MVKWLVWTNNEIVAAADSLRVLFAKSILIRFYDARIVLLLYARYVT